MIWNEEKSKEQIKAERAVEQAKERLIEANRKVSQKKKESENRHKYMMGGIVHKHFLECYEFDELELNRILASAIKSKQYHDIIEIVRNEDVGNGKLKKSISAEEDEQNDGES